MLGRSRKRDIIMEGIRYLGHFTVISLIMATAGIVAATGMPNSQFAYVADYNNTTAVQHSQFTNSCSLKML